MNVKEYFKNHFLCLAIIVTLLVLLFAGIYYYRTTTKVSGTNTVQSDTTIIDAAVDVERLANTTSELERTNTDFESILKDIRAQGANKE